MTQLTSAKRLSRHTRAKPSHSIPIRAVPPRAQPLRQSGCSCGGGCPTCKAQSQTLPGPDHSAEREAEAVAAQVMSMPEPASVQRMEELPLMRQPGEDVMQMQVEAEDEEESTQMQAEEELPMQAKAEHGGGAGVPTSGGPMVGLGGGRPLSASLRRFFEPRFGRSFAGVRIYDGPAAQVWARSLKAQAFTYGRNIVFGPGRYRPDSPQGRHLLAHELTHVVQQRQDSVNQTIMRVEAEDCSALEIDLFVRHFAAQRLLKKAIQMTAERDARKDRLPSVKAALLKWFKIDLDGAMPFENSVKLGHVENAMQTTLDGSDNVSYECSEEGFFEFCKPGRNAVTAANIHICPSWWSEPPDRQAMVLIHEWGHKYGKGINRILETYCWEKDWTTLPSKERIQMPDAYEGYISELTLGTGTC